MTVEPINFETAATMFETQVHAKLQNTRRFAGAVYESHGNRGESKAIPIGEIAEMNEVGFGSGNMPVQKLGATQVVVTPGNFAMKTVIGGGEQTLFAYDKIAYHARQHGKAAGRFLDYLVLEAIYEDGTGTARFQTIDKTVGINTGLNVDKLSLATDTLEDEGVDSMINALVPAKCRSALKKDPQFSSWDYNMERPLMKNNLKGYLDIAFYSVGNKGKNAIPFVLNGTTREYEVPVFGYDCIELVFNRNVQTRMWYNPGEDRTELLTVATARGKVLQNDGVIIMACDAPAVAN